MIVETGSRLHFGLLNLGGGPRRFGGVGLMIAEPAVRVRVEPARSWSAEGPRAARALTFARQWCGGAGRDAAFHIAVEACPPEHVGLGTGTQLGLATTRALAEACGEAGDAPLLAKRLGRGARSALGIHGFTHGGFLVDGGKTAATDIAPLIARAEFPDDWHVLLVIPRGLCGRHGASETAAFEALSTPGQADVLCRLVLLGMLPALHERDLPGFGDALYEFNRRVGELFAPLQAGAYANPRSAELVAWLRGQGLSGVGQSSWGPAVFAVAQPEHVADLARRLPRELAIAPGEVIITTGMNRPAHAHR